MGRYQSFAIPPARGASHIKHDIVCQDFSHSEDIDGICVAAVADGHGDANCMRSDRGAKFAVDCAIKGIHDFVKLYTALATPASPAVADDVEEKSLSARVKGLFKIVLTREEEGSESGEAAFSLPSSQNEWDREIRQRLIKYIIWSWREMVAEDHEANPFTAEELEKADEKYRKRYEAGGHVSKAYGCTLIACAVTADYWLGIHIGDGRLSALYADGGFGQPVPWDEKCFLNATTSICDDDAFERARFYISSDKENFPAAVFLCTDGVDDNYPVDGNEKHLFKLYRTVALTFAEEGFETTLEQLGELANSFATKGKGDDTSIAGFVDMEAIKKTRALWEEQEESGKGKEKSEKRIEKEEERI